MLYRVLTGPSKIFLLCQPVSKLRPKKLGVLELVLAKKGPKRNFQLGPIFMELGPVLMLCFFFFYLEKSC